MYQFCAGDPIGEYLATLTKHSPKIVWKISEKKGGEGYCSTYDQGLIHIQAESPIAAAYGINRMKIASACGHIGEYLGRTTPRFPLRPMWVGCGSETTTPQGIELALPYVISSGFDQQKAVLFCRRVVELGYNAVIIGNHVPSTKVMSGGSLQDLNQFCHLLQNYGIKVILKPNLNIKGHQKNGSRCPVDTCYSDFLIPAMKSLCDSIPCIDFIFWESCLLYPEFTRHDKARDLSLPEIVAAEARLIEEAIPADVSLIFFIPSPNALTAKQHSLWMPSFCDEVGKNTIVSFSAVAGDYFQDHQVPHPFWDQLRQSPDVSSTLLLPIVNVGSVFHGEGLWPALPFDLFEKYYSRLHRHHFAGVVTLVNRLPKSSALLDCSLWTASQLLWRNDSPGQLIETWFQAHRPDWDVALHIDTFRSIRQIVVDLSYLRSLKTESHHDMMSSEECRLMSESLLIRLKELQMRMEKSDRKKIRKYMMTSSSDYMQVFVRDAQRIVLNFLQYFNLSCPYAIGNEALQESFWMHATSSGGQGLRSGTKATFFDEPLQGPAGSAMEAIFHENRYT